MEITNNTQLSPTPVPQRIENFLYGKSDPYHMNAGGMNVELRYNSEAPSLQQKMIQLCQQMS